MDENRFHLQSLDADSNLVRNIQPAPGLALKPGITISLSVEEGGGEDHCVYLLSRDLNSKRKLTMDYESPIKLTDIPSADIDMGLLFPIAQHVPFLGSDVTDKIWSIFSAVAAQVVKLEIRLRKEQDKAAVVFLIEIGTYSAELACDVDEVDWFVTVTE